MKAYIDRFEQNLLGIDRVGARRVATDLLKDLSPLRVVEQLIVPALERIGNSWEQGRVALSQVYMSGRICEELVDSLLPPEDPNRVHQPGIAIVVLEDYHLLGKRIVLSVLRSKGIHVKDYGTLGVAESVSRVLEDNIEILLISTLMLPSALHVKEVIDRLKKNPRGAKIKVVVGGAPFRFDEELWKEVGADAMGKTAADALKIITALEGGHREGGLP